MEVARANEIEVSECSTSDLIDDGEAEYSETSTTHASVWRRELKREYGDGDDGDGGAAVAERRVRSRLAEQFVLLRETVPNLHTGSTTSTEGLQLEQEKEEHERASILADAYEYIEWLQRQEAELLCELEEDDSETSCCENGGVGCSSCKEVADEERTVEFGGGSDCGSCCSVQVVRAEAGLRIHIECAMKPGLLLSIMELLESHNLSVEEASVECVERLIFNGNGLEDIDGETRVSAEVLGASLRLLLCRPDQQQGMKATVE